MPCNIECGSMVGRRPDDGKAKRDIYAAFKGEHLQRAQSLVMIHGHDGVVLSVDGLMKDDIGRDRSCDVKAFSAGGDLACGGTDGTVRVLRGEDRRVLADLGSQGQYSFTFTRNQ